MAKFLNKVMLFKDTFLNPIQIPKLKLVAPVFNSFSISQHFRTKNFTISR
jgi:hypothetical protein